MTNTKTFSFHCLVNAFYAPIMVIAVIAVLAALGGCAANSEPPTADTLNRPELRGLYGTLQDYGVTPAHAPADVTGENGIFVTNGLLPERTN